jgi:hypothetical protein
MPKPNYSFEKRRKELDRKSKKQRKQQQKLERGASSAPASDSTPTSAGE